MGKLEDFLLQPLPIVAFAVAMFLVFLAMSKMGKRP